MRAPENVVDEIYTLLERTGGEQYFGEAVTQQQHAEQCAWLAKQAGADDELVLAALVHDIGHLLDVETAVRDARVGVINHDEIGAQWLADRGFSPRLTMLVAGHVDAKRYLTATNPAYVERLSPASAETLRLQGGPMTPVEAQAFAVDDTFRDVLRLRAWDEQAKDQSWHGPDVNTYRELLLAHLRAGTE